MIRVNTFLKKNTTLTNEEFHQYWLDQHSVVAMATPSWFDYVRKYVQTHTDHAANPADVAFDGIAQLTLDSFESFSTWKALPELESIWEDEDKVFDRPNLMWVISSDHVISALPLQWDPSGKIKVVGIVRRSSGTSREEFQERWVSEIGPDIQQQPWSDSVLGHMQSHTLPESDPDGLVADGFFEVWFHDLAAASTWVEAYRGHDAGADEPASTDLMMTTETRKRP